MIKISSGSLGRKETGMGALATVQGKGSLRAFTFLQRPKLWFLPREAGGGQGREGIP